MKLSKLKLNSIESENLSNREMKEIKGGADGWCSCSCYWADQGGSSTEANCKANTNLGGGRSYEGDNGARCRNYTN